MSEETNLGTGWGQKITVLPLQKVGDECQSCAKFCDKMSIPRNKLVRLGGTTEEHNAIVPICPWCDSDLILTNTPGQGPEELV